MSAAATEHELSLILPGTWAWIPLADDQAMRKRIVALVKAQVGRADRLATRRRQAVDELTQTAARAKAVGAASFALSLELVPGVPFPASLLTISRDWPVSQTDAAQGETAHHDDAAVAVRARLARSFPAATILEQRTGSVARTAEFFQQRIGAEQAPTLRCEYWLPVPDGSRLLGITISAPTVPEPDLFTQLFDSIVDSVTFSNEPIPTQIEE